MLVRFEATIRIVLVVTVLTAIALYTSAYTLSPLDLLRTNLLWSARFVVFPIASLVLLLFGTLRVFSRLRDMPGRHLFTGHPQARPVILAHLQA